MASPPKPAGAGTRGFGEETADELKRVEEQLAATRGRIREMEVRNCGYKWHIST